MVEDFFGFTSAPFRLSPDARFYFQSASHAKALAYLDYGLKQSEGFIVITGEIGAGKSMMIEYLLDDLDRSNTVAATLTVPNITPDALLSHILSAFQIEAVEEGMRGELEALEDFLYDNVNRGRRVLLIVDEAQSLPLETLEQLRILTNMNDQGAPLFQVFLVGQPEFRDILARPGMEQLRQRVIASHHLERLSAQETREYIEHRLTVVGWRDAPLFTEEAFEAIYNHTSGVPRRINTLCTRVLLFCSLEERVLINSAVVTAVADEIAQELDGDGSVEMLPIPSENGEKSENIAKNEFVSGAETQSADAADTKYSRSATLKDVATAIAEITANQHDSAKALAKDEDQPVLEPTVYVNGRAPDENEHEERGEMSMVSSEETPISDDTHTELVPIEKVGVEMVGDNAEGESENADPQTEDVAFRSVFDQVQNIRKDLRDAHRGNREIYDAINTYEEQDDDNVIEIERHLARAHAIIEKL